MARDEEAQQILALLSTVLTAPADLPPQPPKMLFVTWS